MNAAKLLTELKAKWPDKGELTDPILLGVCKELFGDQFDFSNKVEGIAYVEWVISNNALPDEDVERASLQHNEENPDEFGSKVVDTKELVREYEDHLAAQKGKIDTKRLVDEWLEGQTSLGREQVAQLREQLTRITVTYIDAQEIISGIDPDLPEDKVNELAKDVVQGNEKAIELEKLDEEIKTEFKELAQSIKTEDEVEKAINTAVDEVAKDYEAALGEITEVEKELIKDNLRQQMVQEIYGVDEGVPEDLKIKTRINDENGRIEVVVPNSEDTTKKRPTTPKGVKIISTRTDKTGWENIKAERELDQKVKEISAMADSGGAEWKKKTKELLKMGMGDVNERKMARRFMDSGVQQGRVERGLREAHPATEMTATVRQNIHQARAVMNVLRHGIETGSKVEDTVKNLKDLSDKFGGKVKGLKEASDAVGGALEKLGGVEKGIKSLQFVQDIMKMQARLQEITNPMMWLSKIKGFEGLAQFGSQSYIEMTAAMASQISVNGLREGLLLSFRSILTTGRISMATATTTATAGAAAGTEAAIVAGSAFAGPPGWLIALLMLALEALKWAAKNIFNFFKNAVDGFLRLTNTNLDELGLRDAFGNTMGGIMEWGARIGIMFMGILVGLGSLMTIPAGILLIVLLLPMLLIQLQTNGYMRMIAALIPNKEAEYGYCTMIAAADQKDTNKIANCSAGGGTPSGILTNKATFVQLSGGSVNADRCFADVVNKAKAAGVNPDFALLIWLQESGASNYASGKQVADFGQSALGKRNDFNNQINMFLGLYPETKCLNTPNIGNDYWLAWATNFATGDSGEACDPTKVVGGVSGEQYLAKIKNQWKQMTGKDELPASMRTGSGGTGTGLTTHEETDSNGDKWICEVNPNAPGLGGQPPIAMPTLDPNLKIPEGCAIGMPGDTALFTNNITQGPSCQLYSHSGMANAVDFGVPAGTVIKATHNGIARVGRNNIYGNYVDITGSCNGVTFTTRYAHMPDGGPKVGSNIEVKAGQEIGVVDNTGNSTGDHLHYDIRGVSGGSLPMSISDSVFNGSGITKNLAGCCDRGTCHP